MIKRPIFRAAPCCAAMLLAAGCATAPPPPPPMVDLQAENCVSKPEIGHAITMVLDKNQEGGATTEIGAGSPCFEQQGAKGLYAVFALPQETSPAIVTISSIPLGSGVFAPHVVLLDEQGAPLREIARDKFQFHGTALSTLFREHPEDRYVLVVSDPSAVGQSFTKVTETTSQYVGTTGTAVFILYTGDDYSNGFVYTHNGTITVSVAPVPNTKS